MSAFAIRSARSAAENILSLKQVRSIAARLAQAWEVRRAAHALEALDDDVLRDVGVARGDIDYAVRHGRTSA